MEDPNELFGIYFDLLSSTFGPHDINGVDEIQKAFRKAQSHHYMTCWTRAPDNIAVWSLYSPQKDAIQVCTTYGKLNEAVSSHSAENSYSLAYSLEPNDPKDLFWLPSTGPVSYINFSEQYSKIKNQCIDYFNQKSTLLKHHTSNREGTTPSERFRKIEGEIEVLLKKDSEIRKKIFEEPQISGPLLKDIRYQHEQEVRFVLSLKRRDGRTKEEYESHPMAGLDDPSEHPKSENCPPNIFMPFSNSNYTDFQIDGRIENYKFEAISNVLLKYGIKPSRNNAFYEIKI